MPLLSPPWPPWMHRYLMFMAYLTEVRAIKEELAITSDRLHHQHLITDLISCLQRITILLDAGCILNDPPEDEAY